MTAKEYLQKLYQLHGEIEIRLEQIAQLQLLATRTTTILKSTPSSGAKLNSRIETAVINMQDQAAALAEQIQNLLVVSREVSKTIAKIENYKERIVLEYRYLCFYHWQEIAQKLNTSLRHVFKIHSRALKNFSELFSE